MKFLRNLWRRITGKRSKPSKPVHRESSGTSVSDSFFHPLALFKEDLAKLYAPYKFKFSKDYYFILHFTAGRRERRPRDFFKRFLEMNLCTYFIDGAGKLWQQHDGDRCGHHVGTSRWFRKSISKRCTGVEVACPGKVKPHGDKFISWFKEIYEPHEVREITRAMVDQGLYPEAGFFVKFLPEQESTIAELMAWHVAKGLPKENNLGHDIAAWKRGRKNDPGGSLSLPLTQFIEERVLPLVSKYKEN